MTASAGHVILGFERQFVVFYLNVVVICTLRMWPPFMHFLVTMLACFGLFGLLCKANCMIWSMYKSNTMSIFVI